VDGAKGEYFLSPAESGVSLASSAEPIKVKHQVATVKHIIFLNSFIYIS
jgi:hypothetical protein